MFRKSSRTDHSINFVSSLAALEFTAGPERVRILARSIVPTEGRVRKASVFVISIRPVRSNDVKVSLKFRRSNRERVIRNFGENSEGGLDHGNVGVGGASSVQNHSVGHEIQVRMMKRSFSSESRVKIKRSISIGVIEFLHVSSPGEIGLVAGNEVRNKLFVSEVDGIAVNHTHEAIDRRIKRVRFRILGETIFFELSESAGPSSADAIRDSDDSGVTLHLKFEVDATVKSFRTDKRLNIRAFNV